MNEEVIRRRLQTYYDETFKTLSFYPPELVYDIDAGQSPIDVLRDIVNRLSELQQHAKRAAAVGELSETAADRRSTPRAGVCRRLGGGCARRITWCDCVQASRASSSTESLADVGPSAHADRVARRSDPGYRPPEPDAGASSRTSPTRRGSPS